MTRSEINAVLTPEEDAALTPEEAEALAVAAEARAVAAGARAAEARNRAIRLRRDAQDSPDDAISTDAISPQAPLQDAETTSDLEDADTVDPSDRCSSAARRRRIPPRCRRIPRLRRKSVAVVALTALVAASCGLTGVQLWQHHKQQQELQRRVQFEGAAREGVVLLMSLDFHKAKEDVQRVIDNSTGELKKEFQTKADEFVKAAQKAQAVTATTVSDAAVESMTATSAVVIVAATSQVTNAAGAKNEPRSWRISVTVSDESGHLKTAKIEFIP